MFKNTLFLPMVLLLVACDSAPATQLNDNSPITCTYDDMSKLSASIVTLSSTELTDVCTEIEHSLGHAPNVGLVRQLGKVISLMQIKGNAATPKDLAYAAGCTVDQSGAHLAIDNPAQTRHRQPQKQIVLRIS